MSERPVFDVAAFGAGIAGASVVCAQWPEVASVDKNWYFKPDAQTRRGRVAGLTCQWRAYRATRRGGPETLDVATGIHHIETATTLAIRRPLRTWAGLRSFVPGGEMVIGWDARCDNFLWLAGQGGYGIQSAPGASELAAALVQASALPEELARHGVLPERLSPQRLR